MVNCAAMNVGVHVPFWIMVFSGYMPSSGTAESCGRKKCKETERDWEREERECGEKDLEKKRGSIAEGERTECCTMIF